jgi:hypothetical protein
MKAYCRALGFSLVLLLFPGIGVRADVSPPPEWIREITRVVYTDLPNRNSVCHCFIRSSVAKSPKMHCLQASSGTLSLLFKGFSTGC